MSVPEGKRSKGKLNIETEAFKFLDYICDITTKYYLPPEISDGDDKDKILQEHEQCKWFAERMRSMALDCLSQIQEANRIILDDDAEALYERKKHQDAAERALENLHAAASVMYRKRKLKSTRLKKIGTDVGEMKRRIQNWRKSDKYRFTHTNKE